jgi:hypothetical protein
MALAWNNQWVDIVCIGVIGQAHRQCAGGLNKALHWTRGALWANAATIRAAPLRLLPRGTRTNHQGAPVNVAVGRAARHDNLGVPPYGRCSRPTPAHQP